jgi:lipid-binding SYLF domain-containing protein
VWLASDAENPMKKITHYFLAALLGIGFAANVLADDKADLTAKANDAKAEFLRQDPDLKAVFEKAAGYAILPSVGKGAFGVGAARGTGQLFEKDKVLGVATMTQVTIGFQVGGQEYSELIFFEDQKALGDFKASRMEFSAQASAVAIHSGASKDAKYKTGVMIFTMAKGGLMFEASVGGQKFKYEPY